MTGSMTWPTTALTVDFWTQSSPILGTNDFVLLDYRADASPTTVSFQIRYSTTTGISMFVLFLFLFCFVCFLSYFFFFSFVVKKIACCYVFIYLFVFYSCYLKINLFLFNSVLSGSTFASYAMLRTGNWAHVAVNFQPSCFLLNFLLLFFLLSFFSLLFRSVGLLQQERSPCM